MSSRLLIFALTLVAVAVGAANLAFTSPDALRAALAQVDGEVARAAQALPGALASSDASGLELAEAVAADGALREALASASGGPDQALLDRAIAATDATAERARARGVRSLLAVANAEGTALFRRGAEPLIDGEQKIAAIEEALAGRQASRIDTVGNAVFRVAAAPVRGEKATIGAVAVGFALDDVFARALRDRVGADVTIVRAGQVLATSLGAQERGLLQGVLASAPRGATFGFGALPPETFSLFGVLPLPLFAEGAPGNRAQQLPLPGAEDAAVVVSVPAAAALAPVADAQKTQVLLSGVVLVVGLLFLGLARGRRGAYDAADVASLADVAERAVAGDAAARAQEFLPGDLGRIARALNKLTSRARLAAPPESATDRPAETTPAERSAEALAEAFPFGDSDAATTARVPAPEPSAGAAQRSAPAREPTPSPIPAATPSAEYSLGPAFTEASAGPVAAGPSLGPSFGETAGLSLGPSFGETAGPQPPAPPQPRSQTIAWERPPAPAGAADAGGTDAFARALRDAAAEGAEPFNPEATVVAAVPEALLRATSRAAAPARPAPAPADPDEAHFQEVFREFLATRERCGESIGNLTWEKFAAKLQKNRDQLVAKYGCRTVRFTVYVKEGRAALKAAPVRD